jgi:hypothetical protein
VETVVGDAKLGEELERGIEPVACGRQGSDFCFQE